MVLGTHCVLCTCDPMEPFQQPVREMDAQKDRVAVPGPHGAGVRTLAWPPRLASSPGPGSCSAGQVWVRVAAGSGYSVNPQSVSRSEKGSAGLWPPGHPKPFPSSIFQLHSPRQF